MITVIVSKMCNPDLNDSLKFGRVSMEKVTNDKKIKV